MAKKTAHVSEEKKKVVREFVKLCKEYPIVGLVNMENLPAQQLSNMRSQLRGKVVILMTKKRLLKIVFEQMKDEKKGIEKLSEHLTGMPALIFTKDNPFALMSTLNKNKSNAPARGGQIAPKDIIVPAGPTPFAPGPIISELGQAGIKAGIEGGKVAVKADSVVARKGEVIKDKVASILTRLGIHPMEVGLDLIAVYEGGTIFTKDVLSIDESKYLVDLKMAHSWAVNLSVFSGYITKDTIKIMIAKAYRDSKAIGISQGIIADILLPDLLAKADREAAVLKEKTGQ